MTDCQGDTSTTIEILSIEEDKEGATTITFDVDDNFIKLYKEGTGKKRATKKGLQKFLLEIIKKSIHERYK